MRLFIAIEIGDRVKKEIETLLGKLDNKDAGIKWVKPENIHITLRFLGEVKEELLDGIKEVIQRVAERHTAFEIKAKGTGVFPDYSRPRVLWVGVDEDERLKAIFNTLNVELEGIGFPPEERPFRPHLTIGRVKSPKAIKSVLKELRGYRDREFGKIPVKEIVLMKSTLKPTGAEYEKLMTAPLNKEDI